MSEYEETSNSRGRVCPYCRHEYQPEGEDFSEDRREEECGGCGKYYYAEDVFSVRHVAVPDCELNDESHDWRDKELRGGRRHPFCEKCGKCKPISRPVLPEAGEG